MPPKVTTIAPAVSILLSLGAAAAAALLYLGFTPGLFWHHVPPSWWMPLFNALPLVIAVALIAAFFGRHARTPTTFSAVLALVALAAYLYMRWPRV
jgi:cytochrome bd-type quinol oxidase subunit 2